MIMILVDDIFWKCIAKHLIINGLCLQKPLRFSNFKEKFAAFSMKVTDSKDLLCKIIQNIRFRAPIFNQSLQESEHKKACILSHNVCMYFRAQGAPYYKRARQYDNGNT